MGKITHFLESRTWRIIRCTVFIALFIYLTITQIVQLPGTKHIVLILLSLPGILLHVQDLVKILRYSSKDGWIRRSDP